MGNIFGIDLGTSNIKIFNRDEDSLTVEKNMIAIENKTNVFAYGNSAYEIAKDNGFKNIQFFVDDGFSGTNFDRPAWTELKCLIDEDKIGALIVKDMSRLGRDYLKVGFYTEMVFVEITSPVSLSTSSATGG